MNVRILVISILFGTFSAIFSTANASTCETQQEELKSYVESKKKSFEETINNKKTEINDAIKEQTDKMPGTSGEDAKVGLDFDLDWKPETIKLHLPETSMRLQTWKFHLPIVAMKLKEIIWHVPATRMVLMKTGQYPEIHGLTVKWKDIKTLVPETYMEERRIKLHLPELQMTLNEIKLHVPESTMKPHTITMHIPHFTLKNISVETEKVKINIDKTSKEYTTKINTDVNNFKNEMRDGIIMRTANLFQCIRTDLSLQKKSIGDNFAFAETQLAAAAKSLSEHGETQDVAEINKKREELLKKKEQALNSIQKGIEDLDNQEKESVAKIMQEIS